ncbi:MULTISPECIES: hypothetical protein [Actinoalloteichus]|uniref:Uncharacterized protein n=1 Tax=Actinoalloteichus fjordicus TaxID=1612552 RepID=A0AAC9L8C9_9PSEU|nr:MULTISPECIES: hypothetical protein [Actinoalloteichus]APU13048.1 hypothetical protein UA74_04845 [Actinoalloteichus fjordicus]APU19021.1 hypothetical protein UA75_04960 [Actinoalloteichus sp. GBA129-24]
MNDTAYLRARTVHVPGADVMTHLPDALTRARIRELEDEIHRCRIAARFRRRGRWRRLSAFIAKRVAAADRSLS